MPLLPQEFRDNLLEIANYLQGDDYHRVIDLNLKSPLIESEKIEIIVACIRITSVLNEKMPKLSLLYKLLLSYQATGKRPLRRGAMIILQNPVKEMS